MTVRTIQYYDQQGLLSPSAKGPQNQRLYTDDNVQVLYRILTLKYLGLSLAQIKSDADLFQNPEAVQELAGEQMDDIEESFLRLFKRLSTLRELHDAAAAATEVDWKAMAGVVERCQDEGRFFWRLTCIREDDRPEASPEDRIKREKAVSKWHELIADTIRLMPAGDLRKARATATWPSATWHSRPRMRVRPSRTSSSWRTSPRTRATTGRSTSCAKPCSTIWRPWCPRIGNAPTKPLLAESTGPAIPRTDPPFGLQAGSARAPHHVSPLSWCCALARHAAGEVGPLQRPLPPAGSRFVFSCRSDALL